jgi:hypothetical protein
MTYNPRMNQDDDDLGSGTPPPPQGQDNSAELDILKRSLNDAAYERERVTKELEKRTKGHEKALKAKQGELDAASKQLANLKKQLDEASTANAKPGDDTYEHLIGEREKVEEECKRLQDAIEVAKHEFASLEEETKKLRQDFAKEHKLLSELLQELLTVDPHPHGGDAGLADRLTSLIHALQNKVGSLESIQLTAENLTLIELSTLMRIRVLGGVGRDDVTAFVNEDMPDWGNAFDAIVAEKKAAGVPDDLLDLFEDGLKVILAYLATSHGAMKQAVADAEQRANEFDVQLQTAQAVVTDHTACDNEEAALKRQIADLETKNHDLQAAQGTLSAADHTQCEADKVELSGRLQGASTQASNASAQVIDLEGRLKASLEAETTAEREKQKYEDLVVALDPQPTKDEKKRFDRVRALAAGELEKITPTFGDHFKYWPVWIAILMAVVCTGVVMHIRGTTNVVTQPTVENSAVESNTTDDAAPEVSSEGSLDLPAASSSETPLVDAAPKTDDSKDTLDPPDDETETCWNIDNNVMSLLFGQRLKDGKIFGRVPILELGNKRITCDSPPSYDEDTELTDVSGLNCQACVPIAAGEYPVEDYLSKISAQTDPSCYTDPASYRFHKWPRGKSIRINCGESPAPYDAVRNCRDITGCDIVVPDPDEVKCEECGD